MKTFTANMDAHLTQRALTLANMWKLTREDQTVLAFTDHDQPLDFNDGEGTIRYEANAGMTASALSSSNELRVDTQDAAGMLTSDRITVEDLRAGRYDNAEIKFFKVNWNDLTASMGNIKMKITKTGEVRTDNGRFTVELRSLSQAYSQKIIDLVQPACGVDLGSAKCKVRLDPPEHEVGTTYTVREDRDAGTGSVVKPIVFNDRHFKASVAGVSGSDEPTWNTTLGGLTIDGTVTWVAERALTVPEVEITEVIDKGEFWVNYVGDAPNNLFTMGLIEALTGRNIGIKREIKDFDMASDGPAKIKTFLPFPFALQGGVTSTAPDTMTFKAGCEKGRDICKLNFDNIENLHGFPDLPGNDKMFLTPNSPG